MSWAAQSTLWLLVLVPMIAAVLVLGWHMRRRATKRFGDEKTTWSLVIGRPAGWRATRGVLAVLALGLTVVALAGPQYGSRVRILRKRGVDVVVVIDFSKSMLAQDVRPSRIERAKAEVSRFIGELDGDRVGIVAFAGETMQFPMTHDYAAASLFFRDLGPYDMPVGGTAIGRALVAAKALLERSDGSGGPDAHERARERSRVVILLTDGEDHEGEPVDAARELAELGAKIHVVGVGSRTGEPIPTFAPDGTWTGYMRDDSGNPVMTALTAHNEDQLRQIARASGGRYFKARQGTVGMEEIRREMRRMKQQERRSRRVTDREDRYALVLLPAFLLLVLEGILPEAWIARRRRRAQADSDARTKSQTGGKRGQSA